MNETVNIELVREVREVISRWAFLPLNEFENNTSLKSLRPEFGYGGKTGMMVDYFNNGRIQIFEDELIPLDTVNDFVDYINKINGDMFLEKL